MPESKSRSSAAPWHVPVAVEEVAEAIRAVVQGQSLISASMASKLLNEFNSLAKKAEERQQYPAPALTTRELEVLKLLRERSDETVSRDELLEKVWGIQASPTSRTVDNFIVKLRRKLEEDQKNPRHILTVYGLGYKLVP